MITLDVSDSALRVDAALSPEGDQLKVIVVEAAEGVVIRIPLPPESAATVSAALIAPHPKGS